MQLRKTGKVHVKKVEDLLTKENKFVSDIYSMLATPNRNEKESTSEDDERTRLEPIVKKSRLPSSSKRVQTVVELQERLEAMKSKRNMTYKDKLTKKGVKNRLKKKSKQGERNVEQKQLRANMVTMSEIKAEQPSGPMRLAKPVFNSEGKMVFSKFDFSDLGNKMEKKPKKMKNPKKVLHRLQSENRTLEALQERGEIEIAVEIKEKNAWKNALAKAEGEKVKDDPSLLKKTVQKQEQKKRASKKKWKAKTEGVERSQEEKQKKRSENIAKKKKEKKTHKLKKAVKKGKIVPGF